MTTSGTLSTTTFRTRKIIELAYRECKIYPQELTTYRLEVALDLLYLRLSTLSNKGIALWAIQPIILPMYYGNPIITLPLGAVNILDANIRQLTRASGTASASEGTAANAFDGDIDTACTQTAVDGYIQLDLDDATRLTNFGLLPNASGSWTYEIQGSNDGSTWTTLYTATAETEVAGAWKWWDVDGLAAYSSYRLQATGGATILDVSELYFGSGPLETNLALINRNDYDNLPNKTFLGRPTQYWFDMQIDQPLMRLWPAPDSAYTFWQILLNVQNYIQDVGTLRQTLQVPQSWFRAIMLNLGADLGSGEKEMDQAVLRDLKAEAAAAWKDAWDGQSDDAPVNIAPNISAYTR